METSVKLLLRILSIFQLTCVFYTKRIHEDEMWMVGVNSYGGPNHSSKSYPGYGTEWVYFPDGDGVPHFVNLTITDRGQLRTGQYMEIEYRLYIRGLSNYTHLNESAKPSWGTNMTRLLSNKPIKLVTHGWRSSAKSVMVMSIKDAYLKNKDVAVIAVDWSDAAKDFRYPLVVESTGQVGARVGQFLDAFCELYNVSGDRLHLIGHSLGAHLMGVAASTTNVTVGRVTGLDPARPLLEYPKKPSTLTLDSSDAVFVDVIHTCSGALGVKDNIGHADFYPNSGESPQPGCDIPETCSHSRAPMYFSESIDNPTGFPACRSKSWTEFLNNTECKQQTYMGENVDRNAKDCEEQPNWPNLGVRAEDTMLSFSQGENETETLRTARSLKVTLELRLGLFKGRNTSHFIVYSGKSTFSVENGAEFIFTIIIIISSHLHFLNLPSFSY